MGPKLSRSEARSRPVGPTLHVHVVADDAVVVVPAAAAAAREC